MKQWIAPLSLATTLFTLPASAGQINIGATGFNGTLITNFTQETTGPVTAEAFNGENSQLGGGLYFGYIWVVNSGFNIGIEGYYDFINVTVTQSVFDGLALTEEVNGIGGIRALPGFKITNNTELYLELGWAYLQQTFTDPNVPSVSAKKGTSGFRYGAGVQTMIYDNISLRVYYSVIDQLAQIALDSASSEQVTATPNMNIFGIGVAYHFGF